MSARTSAVASGGGRLLVVDDDPFYREIASSSLAAEGYEVAASADGVEALEILSKRQLDLAVVDLTMPRMDGMKLIAHVRESRLNRHLPIVVITGNDDTATIQKAFATGATSFIAKPINWPLFVQHVNFVYRAGQAEAGLRHAVRTSEFMSELKEKLLSVLITELQSPLKTANSMAALIRKEAFGPLGQERYLACADDLYNALQQLSSVQQKMMNAGRQISDDILLIEEDAPVRTILTEVTGTLDERARARGVMLEPHLQLADGLGLRCDRSLVIQAMRLLIEGGLQAAPPGSRLNVAGRVEAGLGFAFTVSDRGPELSEDVIRQILNLQAVSRSDPQVSAIARNASLTICRVLAEAHQGRLELSSAPGEGTVARLVLPKERVVALTQARPVAGGGAATSRPMAGAA